MSDFSLHARAKTYDMCKGNDPQEFKSDVAACRTAIPLHIHTIHKHKGPWVGPKVNIPGRLLLEGAQCLLKLARTISFIDCIDCHLSGCSTT